MVTEHGLGTTLFEPGDEVFGLVRFPQEAGGYGEYVTAPARQLVHELAELPRGGGRSPAGRTHGLAGTDRRGRADGALTGHRGG